ncbi:MAG TPA: hypothetical protein VEL76_07980 [Gemmataceae bacterium]|nr:hypothetical protein [Gemmataceae bacterium]
MPLYACPHCQRRVSVADHALDKEVKCPACAGVFVAEAPAASAASPPTVAPASARLPSTPPPLPREATPDLKLAPSGPALPSFLGIAPFTWRPNRLYRVYVLPQELVFLWAGAGAEATAIGAQFGLIGGLMTAAMRREPKVQVGEGLDLDTVEQLLPSHKHNFRAHLDDLSYVTIDPRSFWLAAMYYQGAHIGVLRFRHRKQGKMSLCLSNYEDMKIALETVPAALGDLVTVNVEWSDYKGRFVRKA